MAATGNTTLDAQSKEFGGSGFTFESGTTAITAPAGTYYAAYFPEDTVIAAITATNSSGDTLVGETMPKESVIYGDITAITLTSGSVFLYKN